MNLSGIGLNNCNCIFSILDYPYETPYLYNFSSESIMIDFNKVKSLISEADRILLTTHENPDEMVLGVVLQCIFT